VKRRKIRKELQHPKFIFRALLKINIVKLTTKIVYDI